jgi:hypothetical protein
MSIEEIPVGKPKDDQVLETIKNLMLDDEEYKTHPFVLEGRKTHVFEASNDAKKIVCFGSPHTSDPRDGVFEQIHETFEGTRPDIVYIEGWGVINKRKDIVRQKMQGISLEEAKREGEGFFTLKLAADAGTDFESPEPDFRQEIDHSLNRGFAKRDIFAFYLYRSIAQYQRETSERSIEDCKKYLIPFLETFQEESGWDSAELHALEREVLTELDVQDEKKYQAQVDPIPWDGKPQTVLNEISRNSNRFRDEYIVDRIAEGLKQYDTLFVVYGSAHAVKMEPALRALLV